jgi:hypothetical protein
LDKTVSLSLVSLLALCFHNLTDDIASQLCMQNGVNSNWAQCVLQSWDIALLHTPCFSHHITHCIPDPLLDQLAVGDIAVVVEVQAVNSQGLLRLQQFRPVGSLPSGFIHLREQGSTTTAMLPYHNNISCSR